MSRPGTDQDGDTPTYHLIAVLDFDDQAAFGGPEGQAAVVDLANIALA